MEDKAYASVVDDKTGLPKLGKRTNPHMEI